MKRLTISTLLSGVLFLTSCNDFLNQEPLDQLSPNEYLTTESNIAAFATDQYQVKTNLACLPALPVCLVDGATIFIR